MWVVNAYALTFGCCFFSRAGSSPTARGTHDDLHRGGLVSCSVRVSFVAVSRIWPVLSSPRRTVQFLVGLLCPGDPGRHHRRPFPPARSSVYRTRPLGRRLPRLLSLVTSIVWFVRIVGGLLTYKVSWSWNLLHQHSLRRARGVSRVMFIDEARTRRGADTRTLPWLITPASGSFALSTLIGRTISPGLDCVEYLAEAVGDSQAHAELMRGEASAGKPSTCFHNTDAQRDLFNAARTQLFGASWCWDSAPV